MDADANDYYCCVFIYLCVCTIKKPMANNADERTTKTHSKINDRKMFVCVCNARMYCDARCGIMHKQKQKKEKNDLSNNFLSPLIFLLLGGFSWRVIVDYVCFYKPSSHHIHSESLACFFLSFPLFHAFAQSFCGGHTLLAHTCTVHIVYKNRFVSTQRFRCHRFFVQLNFCVCLPTTN